MTDQTKSKSNAEPTFRARVILTHGDHAIDDIVEFAGGEEVPEWADPDPAAVAYAISLDKA